MIKYLLCFVWLISASVLHSEVYYIRPKAYLDVTSGKMISQKVIGIDNGIITSIEAKAPLGKTVYGLEDLFLLPGLIDCHTHVFLTQTIEDKRFATALLREEKYSDAFRTKRAKIFLKQYLAEGFTSICDLGNSGQFLDVKLKDKIYKDPRYPDGESVSI